MRDAATPSARRPSPSSPSVSPVPLAARGTVLAFDFGEKRIGVAVGEIETRLAHPLPGIDAERADLRFAAITGLLAEWRPARLVVGLPLSGAGEPHAMTLRAQRFARQLEGRYALPVTLVDERYTSVEAESRRGTDPGAARHGIDSAAAQLILQQFFGDLDAGHQA